MLTLVCFRFLWYSVLMNWLDPVLREFVSLRVFLPFIPLFVAFDGLGILPIFFSLTSEMTKAERKKVVYQSTLTGFIASIGFLAVGKSVFDLLGITVSDFKVAGGILLFIIAIVDLIFPERTRTFPKETLGVVPIGIPLIVGPGVLTLLLICAQTYGYVSTVLCLILNLLTVWLLFGRAHLILRLLKEGGTKGIGKIFALLLAAFAMMMIRTGIVEWIGS
ncbi:MAG TPA: MarC family protein [Thermodesulfobacteriota bacterium]|nr:MarC family protein [Thermodesulfobacteriota bacterium]